MVGVAVTFHVFAQIAFVAGNIAEMKELALQDADNLTIRGMALELKLLQPTHAKRRFENVTTSKEVIVLDPLGRDLSNNYSPNIFEPKPIPGKILLGKEWVEYDWEMSEAASVGSIDWKIWSQRHEAPSSSQVINYLQPFDYERMKGISRKTRLAAQCFVYMCFVANEVMSQGSHIMKLLTSEDATSTWLPAVIHNGQPNSMVVYPRPISLLIWAQNVKSPLFSIQAESRQGSMQLERLLENLMNESNAILPYWTDPSLEHIAKLAESHEEILIRLGLGLAAADFLLGDRFEDYTRYFNMDWKCAWPYIEHLAVLPGLPDSVQRRRQIAQMNLELYMKFASRSKPGIKLLRGFTMRIDKLKAGSTLRALEEKLRGGAISIDPMTRWTTRGFSAGKDMFFRNKYDMQRKSIRQEDNTLVNIHVMLVMIECDNWCSLLHRSSSSDSRKVWDELEYILPPGVVLEVVHAEALSPTQDGYSNAKYREVLKSESTLGEIAVAFVQAQGKSKIVRKTMMEKVSGFPKKLMKPPKTALVVIVRPVHSVRNLKNEYYSCDRGNEFQWDNDLSLYVSQK